jgi:hypothetical protein
VASGQHTAQRTKKDIARQMKLAVDVYFPDAELIHLVVDNLNTHTDEILLANSENELIGS